jgi:hypothetical protein
MTLIATGVLNPNYTPPLVIVEPPADNGTRQLVTDGWNRSQVYADNAFNSAQQYLDRLYQIARTLVSPYIDPHLLPIDLNIAQFDHLISTAPATPANTFGFTEIPYSSNLLTDLRARLLEWVDGTATGILPSVEQAIWNRGRAREAVASGRKAQEAIRTFAMRGFQKPPGALSLELQEAAQEAQNNDVSLNRDIIIKQAELEQSNRRFSLEQAWKVEEGSIAYMNNQMQRALDKAKIYQQFVNDIFHETVVEYGVEAQVYSARVGAETSAFKAKTDMQVAEANIRVEAARVQLQTWIQEITVLVEAVKAGATVSAQLAASALSSISLSGQLADHNQNSSSNSATNSTGNTTSFGVTTGANYNYTGSA